MKKILAAAGLVIAMAGCGNGNNAEEQTTDSTNMNNANQSPMGDTGSQINSNAGNYPMDTSNQNGDDSVKGTNPASRSTTPGGGDQRRSGGGNQ